ncbi:MAG TPA: hypothetical protein VFO55_14485 [Gemmatimonadaceae bacterium]|nr:hypothetical protein [Gemmatimonadaceae bacterium]
MQSRTVFCSACDQDVNIMITDEPSQDGHANLHEAEVVCLEIGHHCTGSLCPVGATSPTVMAARLVRSGLQTKMHPVINRYCIDCGDNREFVVIGRERAMCSVCGGVLNYV